VRTGYVSVTAKSIADRIIVGKITVNKTLAGLMGETAAMVNTVEDAKSVAKRTIKWISMQ
jgi:DNA transposition AAA+ family ATPase